LSVYHFRRINNTLNQKYEQNFVLLKEKYGQNEAEEELSVEDSSSMSELENEG
jgi:hypothetical protein